MYADLIISDINAEKVMTSIVIIHASLATFRFRATYNRMWACKSCLVSFSTLLEITWCLGVDPHSSNVSSHLNRLLGFETPCWHKADLE